MESRATIDKTKSSNYNLIDSIIDCINIVENILLKESIIAVDCEGILLSKEGRLTLIQISLSDGRVFLFDILKGGSLMFLGLSEDKRGLKSVFENKKILKIFHDVRSDWDSLLHQYSVRIYNFVDTQEAFFVWKLFHTQDITMPISLLNLIAELLKINLEHKHKYKHLMAYDPNMWAVRPLPDEHLAYASEDVVYLIEAWNKMKTLLNKNLEEIVCFLTILKVIDGNIFGQFREYIVANVLYYGMVSNVFFTKELFSYFVQVDYVYNFLKIKIMSDDNVDNTEASAIIKYGIHFKIKQKVDEFTRLKDSRIKGCFEKTSGSYSKEDVRVKEGDNASSYEGIKEDSYSKKCKYSKKKERISLFENCQPANPCVKNNGHEGEEEIDGVTMSVSSIVVNIAEEGKNVKDKNGHVIQAKEVCITNNSVSESEYNHSRKCSDDLIISKISFDKNHNPRDKVSPKQNKYFVNNNINANYINQDLKHNPSKIATPNTNTNNMCTNYYSDDIKIKANKKINHLNINTYNAYISKNYTSEIQTPVKFTEKQFPSNLNNVELLSPKKNSEEIKSIDSSWKYNVKYNTCKYKNTLSNIPKSC